MLLYIVRHAWAEERDDATWPNDDLRPLTEKGRDRFTEFVKVLARRIPSPKLVATSPLVRCRQTAEVLAAGVTGKPKVVQRAELAPNSNLDSLVEWTTKEAGSAEAVAWVGHAPDVGLMTSALVGEGRGAIHFAKGAIAAIEFDGPPKVGSGELLWLVTAKLVGC